MHKYIKSLFIFRRDLRLDDNTALIEALKNSQKVMCIFIFDPIQVGEKNSYRSIDCIRFMIESLIDLEKQLEKHDSILHIFYGDTKNILKELIASEKIEAIFLNHDYTPFSIQRDKKIENLCVNNKIDFKSYSDVLLNEPEATLKSDGKPYTIFTPYYKNASKLKIKEPIKNKYNNYYKSQDHKNFTIKHVHEINNKIYNKVLSEQNILSNPAVHGGRINGLKILKDILHFKNYEQTHNIPNLPTTHLSAHNKFGTVSIREVYHAMKEDLGNHPIIRQLYWRDFFTQIAFYFPEVFGHEFHEKYRNLKWSYDKKLFELWCEGKTGFPIVDAGMRQLNGTGFMHNRVRMIVASFLTKDLHIDWRWGEKYFAQKLIDYDPAVNNGNWQWSASTGCDSQPYFRIFNPWLQQKRFDPNCEYIKTWIPELKNINNKDIMAWHKNYSKYKIYHKPIVDHTIESKTSKNLFLNLKIKK